MAKFRTITGKTSLDLAAMDCSDTGGITKEQAAEQLKALGEELAALQELMFAAPTHGLLLVFQGRDTAGKDGAINKLLEFINVQSCRVTGFKVPTYDELSHDFLWRVHKHTPAKGGIAIFNRSHYEDVLAVRVHKLKPEEVWKNRYKHIVNFEKLLSDEGTIIHKVFLNISKNEQEKRLLAREADPIKAWKLNAGDWRERELWDDYTRAYDDAISESATKQAPWHLIPADYKWYRNLCVAQIVVEALRPLKEEWMSHLASVGKAAKQELEDYRKSKSTKGGK